MIAWLVELISQFYGLIVQFGNDVRLIFFLFFLLDCFFVHTKQDVTSLTKNLGCLNLKRGKEKHKEDIVTEDRLQGR